MRQKGLPTMEEEMVVSYDEARQQGMIAFERGHKPSSNPYRRGTHTWFGWSDGYDYAYAMSKD